MDIKLFDKRYVYLEWSDELEGKDCILAKSYKDLKDFVNSGDEGRFCKAHKGKEKPFTNLWSECDFCYYDPNLKVKKSWIEGKIIQKECGLEWEDYIEELPRTSSYFYNIKWDAYEWRIKPLESEDSTFNSINDCAIENEKGEIMNDYFFTIRISDIKGGNCTDTKCVISAENVENAENKMTSKFEKIDKHVVTIHDVKKL